MSIWSFEDFKNSIDSKYQLTLGEGNTPIDNIDIDGVEVVFKREDQNPNRSFKDRSLAYQISKYYQDGVKKFVISSSGNAAVSAAAYCGLVGLELDVFVSENIPEYKLLSIPSPSPFLRREGDVCVKVHKVMRPKSDAIKFARETGAVNLRGSMDDNAIVGFKTLGYELAKQVPDADGIFTCCSSGTSAVGIRDGYTPPSPPYNRVGTIVPQIHIVQTTKINPIGKEFDNDFEATEDSIANAVSDRVAHRKQRVVDLIHETKGTGWVVGDNEIRNAKEFLVSKGIEIEGYNAYVGFAGYLKAVKSGLKFEKPVVLITGI